MVFLINLVEFLNYFGDGSRRYVEGENVYDGNHLMYKSITKESKSSIELFFLCLKSSDLQGSPHEINIKMFMADGNKKIECKCSCPAGALGKCKHSVAAMIFLLKNDKSSLETATCTDLKQLWGKLKVNAHLMYETVPLENMCHGFQKPFKYPELDSINVTKAQDILLKDNPNSMLAKLLKGYKEIQTTSQAVTNSVKSNDNITFIQREQCEKVLKTNICQPIEEESTLYCHYLSNIKVPVKFRNLNIEEKVFYEKEVKVDINKAVQLCSETENQKENIWMYERKKRITASVAYSFMTYFDKKHSAAEWEKKINTHLQYKFEGNADTQHGILCEKNCRLKYQKTENKIVTQCGLLVHPNIPYLGFSPDGLVFDANGNLELILEIKSPKVGKLSTAKEAVKSCKWIKKKEDGTLFLNPRHPYYGQVQLGMFITEAEKCDFLVYASFDNSYEIIKVEYDSDFILEKVPKLTLVYFKYMLSKIMHLKMDDVIRHKKLPKTMQAAIKRKALQDITN